MGIGCDWSLAPKIILSGWDWTPIVPYNVDVKYFGVGVLGRSLIADASASCPSCSLAPPLRGGASVLKATTPWRARRAALACSTLERSPKYTWTKP